MGCALTEILLFCVFLLLLDPSLSHPLCTDSRAPFITKTLLGFCSYNGNTCCNSTEDSVLQKQFQAMNISDSKCASLLKSILCAKCDQFSAELFRVESKSRTVPVLCNSTLSENSSRSTQAADSFCSEVWDSCQNVSVMNSPFSPALQNQAGIIVNSKSSKLTEFWQSKADFCDAFGGASSDGAVCYSGEPVALNATEPPNPPDGLCLEKLDNGSYLNMVAHPDGSNRAFFSDQAGKIWLATIPGEGSGRTLELDESNPFLDITDEVHFDTEFGLLGIAFHPNFAKNGRFFASFNCDKAKWPGCSGRCACNSDVDCDPSSLPQDNGAQPCQYQSVIAEFTADSSGSQPSMKSAKPVEVRRIFTMGLPYTSHHGGQILFGPADGYLYFLMGDGGGVGDPQNFSQNKKSLLGTVIRIDVDNVPSAAEINKLGLWGNYSIPKDNPFVEDTELQPEIWALGLRNSWRCSFDSERPSYFMCADVGQDRYEEINMIYKDGNYGWPMYEGPDPYASPRSSRNSTSANSTNLIFPVMGYEHSIVSKNQGSASIVGGYFYRSRTDPCTYGRYLFADLYGSYIWGGIESPEDSGNFTTSQLHFRCARDSPVACSYVPADPAPALGYIYSFGEDNSKDVYLLASSGVYRFARPSRCNYTCSKENATAIASPGPPALLPSRGSQLCNPFENSAFLFSFLLLVLHFMFQYVPNICIS